MSMHDIDKAYVSPYDKFLFEFDKTHEKTESQLKEIEKNRKIAEGRDNVKPDGSGDVIWTEF